MTLVFTYYDIELKPHSTQLIFFLALPSQHDAIYSVSPRTLQPSPSCISKHHKFFTWAAHQLFEASCLLDGQWLQKEYILVQLLMVSPRGASKMAVLWNSVIVFLKGNVAIKSSDGSMWQQNLRDSWDRVGLQWVAERKMKDEEEGKAYGPLLKRKEERGD